MIAEKDQERKRSHKSANPRIDIVFEPRRDKKKQKDADLERIIADLEDEFTSPVKKTDYPWLKRPL